MGRVESRETFSLIGEFNKMINFIYASDKDGLIGVGNELPWHDHEEFQHFKETTKGHVIVMGYKTWESIDKKPLPHRQNFILVRDKENLSITDGTFRMVTLDELLTLEGLDPYLKIFIIGGATTFKLFEPYVNGFVYHSVLMNDAIKNKSLIDSFSDIYYQPSDNLMQRLKLVETKNLTNFNVNVYKVN